ncbi:MAG: hypothetical protein JSU63_14710 [Phycisphaerales bacterium]|nr:MAG: hypothetical protein JSU63_14710 [Phycisphaerales bacterium]
MRLVGGRSVVRAIGALAVVILILETPGAVQAAGGRRISLADRLHHGPGVANHPVNVRPSSAVRIPPDWPLGSDGTITCFTCHSKLPEVGHGVSPNLRARNEDEIGNLEFCINCHQHSGERTAAAMHWQAVGVAHVKEDSGSRHDGGLLDSASRSCMGCHDGVSASESANSTAWNRGPGSRGDSRRNHPVGVSYAVRSSKQLANHLRPVALLPPEIRLPNGQVSCTSCHDLYGTERGRLAVPIEGSKLCFSCHDLD